MAKLRIRKNPGGSETYVLDWCNGNGVRHRDPLGGVGVLPKRDAERVLKQKQLELTTGFEMLNPAKGRATKLKLFAPDYLRWRAGKYPPSHYRIDQIVRDYLIPKWGEQPMDAIGKKDVELWMQALATSGTEEEPAPKSATVAKYLRTLVAMLNKAVEWKELRENPIAGFEPPLQLDSKPSQSFTKPELDAIYLACAARVNGGQGPQANPLHAHLWRLLANTGLRRGEAMMLQWSWVGTDALKILSTEKQRTKSGQWREIPLTDGANTALGALPRNGAYVLPRMALPSLSRAAIKDIQRAGLQGSIHTFRHTYISHLVMAGVALRTVQVLAGHLTAAVTEKYAHLAPGYLQAAGRAISL